MIAVTGLPLEQLRERAALACFDHQSPEIRMTATSLVIVSASAGSPFSDRALDLIKSALKVFFSETDARIRGEVVNVVKILTTKLFTIIGDLQRSMDFGETAAFELNEVAVMLRKRASLATHRAFASWLHAFLLDELSPGLNIGARAALSRG